MENAYIHGNPSFVSRISFDEPEYDGKMKLEIERFFEGAKVGDTVEIFLSRTEILGILEQAIKKGILFSN